jgi:hypothetical protein
MEEERRRYLQLAKEFFDIADRELRSGPQSKPVVADLVWHGTELSLKALAVGHGMPWDHDLDKVTKHLLDNSVLSGSDLGYLKPFFVHVTGSHDYTDTRYPEKDPRYWQNMTTDQLAEGLNAGLEVHKFVIKRLTIKLI